MPLQSTLYMKRKKIELRFECVVIEQHGEKKHNASTDVERTYWYKN